MDEIERARRMAAEGERQIRAARDVIPAMASELAAQRTMQEISEGFMKRQAEKEAAPLIARDALLALNERVDGLLDATENVVAATRTLADAAKAQADESATQTRQTRWIVLLSLGILAVSIAALIVALYH
jgi:hypothetical protein